jgi:hypothetical protein
MCSFPLRCWVRFEMTGWRNRTVVFPSQSSTSLRISSSSSSRGKPASAVVAHTFWSGMPMLLLGEESVEFSGG